MSKSISLADLTEALKPLVESIRRLQEDNTTKSVQISEIHEMITTISVKLDAVDQNVKSTTSSIRTAGKKLVGRKGTGSKKDTVKKAPVKRGAKKAVDDEPEGSDVDVESVADDNTEEVEVKTPSTTTSPPKKTVVKTVRTIAKPKKVAKEEVKKPAYNKMTFFRKEFEEDESQFSSIITTKVKKEVEGSEKGKAALEGKSGDSLKRARSALYYHYIKDNHEDVLNGLRDKFDEQQE